jgi:hypothetical protein
MINKRRSVTDRIESDVYHKWDNEINGVEKARNMLKKMRFQEIDSLKDIDEIRLLLSDLTNAEIKCIEQNLNGSITSARLYSKELKEKLENYPNYLTTQRHKQDYAKALNNYVHCYKKELSNEELIKIYKFCYETYKRCDPYNVEGYLEKLIAKLNLSLLEKNFSNVLVVAEDMLIHNNSSQYDEAFQELIKEVNNINIILCEKILLLQQQIKVKYGTC